jgi:chromate transporter
MREAPQPGDAANADGGPPGPRSAGELFLAYAWISMRSFGGALTFVERTVVQDKCWLSAREFVGLYALAQVLPGPTGISFCVMLGDRFFGLRGAAAALAGFLLLPCAIVIAVATVFQQFQHVPQVQGALHGMGAASVGLIITTALRMARTLRGERVGIAVALASFGAVGLARLPVGTVMLSLGLLSIALAWRSAPR